MTGATVRFSSCRTSSSAAVENTSGITGPAATSSSMAAISRAWSTPAMNGMVLRSNVRSGNCSSSALPIVSALMPVLSDRKKTGTTASSASLMPTS